LKNGKRGFKNGEIDGEKGMNKGINQKPPIKSGFCCDILF